MRTESYLICRRNKVADQGMAILHHIRRPRHPAWSGVLRVAVKVPTDPFQAL